MMKLTKYENQYSRNVFEYEVLEREKIEEIIDNLDIHEVSRKLTEKALEYAGTSGYAFAEMCIDNGKVIYQVQPNNTESAEPNLWVRIMDFGDVQRLDDLPDDYILCSEEIDEIYKLMDEDSFLTYDEAYEKVVEDNNIDIDERIKEYYLDNVAYDLEFRDDIKESLDDVYMNY